MESYKQRLLSALANFDFSELDLLVALILRARKQSATVYLAGNGGSASTVSHYANDWMLGTGIHSPSLRVINLAESNAAITATGNDQDFSRIFVRQLEHLGNEGDVFIALSASGNSENLLEAVRFANANGLRSVGITGFGGGKIRSEVHLSIHVPTSDGDYGVAEDIHLTVGHAVKEKLIEAVLRET